MEVNIENCNSPCLYSNFRTLGPFEDTIGFYSNCLGKDISVGNEQAVLYGVISSNYLFLFYNCY